jgi:hypothetical protein
MVKELLVSQIMTDEEISDREGEYFPESHYHTILTYDCDVYKKVRKGDKYVKGDILLKFRKNVIPKSATDNALKGLRDASKKKHENRGAAAGVLDRKKMPAYIGEFIKPGKFRTGFVSAHSGKTSKQATSNLSQSNIVGFFDVPDRNKKGKGAPCRLTAFNRDNPELWENTLPFFERCDQIFKKLTPERHEIQRRRAQSTPNFAISNTAFSTVTINYSWRTGLHRDAGDLKEGFGNLVVIEDFENKNKYKGCYLGFPQYGVAADPRTGDFLSMDVHEWHGNTEFIPVSKQISGKQKDKDVINDWYFNRLSIVMYLRDKMIRCKDDKLWKDKAGGGMKNIEDLYEDEYLLNNLSDSEDEQTKYQFNYEHPYFKKNSSFIINTIPILTEKNNESDESDESDKSDERDESYLMDSNYKKNLSRVFHEFLPNEYLSFINKRYDIFV